jgi:hypothetical protein
MEESQSSEPIHIRSIKPTGGGGGVGVIARCRVGIGVGSESIIISGRHSGQGVVGNRSYGAHIENDYKSEKKIERGKGGGDKIRGR